MKTFTKKYCYYVEGVATLIQNIEITASQFWKMKNELDSRVTKTESDDILDCDEYTVEKFENINEGEKVTRYEYRYVNGCSAIGLYMYVCKEGYQFKHKGE